MGPNTLTLVVAMALTACGCSGKSPAQPSPPGSPSSSQTAAPAQSGVTDWSVTQRFGSVTGPDNCWVQAQRARLSAAVFPDLPTKVTRADGSIKLTSGFFQVNYAGAFVGSDFSATGEIPLVGNAAVPCPGGTVQQLPGVSSLSGRFSSDDRVLTATETNTYPLASGGTVIYKWDWQATRRD